MELQWSLKGDLQGNLWAWELRWRLDSPWGGGGTLVQLVCKTSGDTVFKSVLEFYNNQ
jgi:hypothetical protein